MLQRTRSDTAPSAEQGAQVGLALGDGDVGRGGIWDETEEARKEPK